MLSHCNPKKVFKIENACRDDDVLSKDNDEDLKNISPQNVIRLIDSFIQQMRQTRKTFLIHLFYSCGSYCYRTSIFMLQHPSFFAILEKKTNLDLFFSNWSYYTVFSMFGGGNYTVPLN